MGSFPLSHQIPWADPPYNITLHRNGEAVLFTDNIGKQFEIINGKMEQAAFALLERALSDIQRYVGIENRKFKHREGAINFIIENSRIIDIEPHYTKEDFKDYPKLIESRTEVFQIIDIMKTAMKMKAFL